MVKLIFEALQIKLEYFSPEFLVIRETEDIRIILISANSNIRSRIRIPLLCILNDIKFNTKTGTLTSQITLTQSTDSFVVAFGFKASYCNKLIIL